MFSKEYFQKMYAKESYIDGDFNAREHAKYLASLFSLMELDVSKIVDFGFGKARLLYELNKYLKPKYVEACDISNYALERLKEKEWSKSWVLKEGAIHTFRSRHLFDLGICNSVLQYVNQEHLEESVATMAKCSRYLYLHVPTSEDYQVFKSQLDFEDPYAIQRPNEEYRKLIKKYFHIVAYGMLESKMHREKETPFIDSFYRF